MGGFRRNRWCLRRHSGIGRPRRGHIPQRAESMCHRHNTPRFHCNCTHQGIHRCRRTHPDHRTTCRPARRYTSHPAGRSALHRNSSPCRRCRSCSRIPVPGTSPRRSSRSDSRPPPDSNHPRPSNRRHSCMCALPYMLPLGSFAQGNLPRCSRDPVGDSHSRDSRSNPPDNTRR